MKIVLLNSLNNINFNSVDINGIKIDSEIRQTEAWLSAKRYVKKTVTTLEHQKESEHFYNQNPLNFLLDSTLVELSSTKPEDLQKIFAKFSLVNNPKLQDLVRVSMPELLLDEDENVSLYENQDFFMELDTFGVLMNLGFINTKAFSISFVDLSEDEMNSVKEKLEEEQILKFEFNA